VRDEKLARPWAIPGTKGLEHRIGGIEKEHITGNISYDPENHEFMVKLRQEKVDKIADYIPAQQLDSGPEKGRIAVLAWGSTYGVIRSALRELREEGIDAAHIHLRYINPFPKNLEAMLRNYDVVLVPEINNGQLVRIIRDRFLIDAKPLNKIKGVPFATSEIKSKIKELLGA